MKLCVIGGGGARSVFLTKSLVKNARDLNIDHIVLMDIDENKLGKYGVLAQEIAFRLDSTINLELTTDSTNALAGADYIITTLRVGGDEARLFDEQTCLKYGVLGQETTGAGGFAMAIRSIPALLEYCRQAKELSHPGHLIFNFTNPSGIVTQALRSCGFHNVYGICDAPSGFVKQLEGMLGIPNGELDVDCYGLNHFSWFDHASVNGVNIQDKLLSHPDLYRVTEMRLFDPLMTRWNAKCMLNEYFYFYYHRIKSLELINQAKYPRGELIYNINRELEEELQKLDVRQNIDKAFGLYMTYYEKRENAYFSAECGEVRPNVWQIPTLEEFLQSPDEGGYAAVALNFIRAISRNERIKMILSVPNEGAIEGLAQDDVVEISCIIDRLGAHPIKMGSIDEFQLLQIKRIKYFERCTIKAIMEQDKDTAAKGLYMHPLVNDLKIAGELTEIFLKKYANYINNCQNQYNNYEVN